MRRFDRKNDGWRTRDRSADAGTAKSVTDCWTLVWNETNRRANAWGRAHRSRMGNVSWNALFEKVRDELLGVAWAVKERRECARRLYTPAAIC